MRYIRYALIATFALALVIVALANRETVRVQVLPPEVASLVGMNPGYGVPLFIVIFVGVLAGLIVGLVWEWMREHKDRVAAARQAREMQRLRSELHRLKGEKHQGKDEVLALLEQAS